MGRREAEERTTAGLWKSIDHYRQPIQKDPNYALAYSGIADSYIQLGLDSLSPKEAFKAAKDHAEKAIKWDPGLAEARVSLGTCYLLYDWDWAAARRELDLAITYDQNYADSYHFYSHYFQIMGSLADAIAMMKHAEGLDPTSAVIKTELAWGYYANRDYDRAIRKYLEMRHDGPQLRLDGPLPCAGLRATRAEILAARFTFRKHPPLICSFMSREKGNNFFFEFPVGIAVVILISAYQGSEPCCRYFPKDLRGCDGCTGFRHAADHRPAIR